MERDSAVTGWVYLGGFVLIGLMVLVLSIVFLPILLWRAFEDLLHSKPSKAERNRITIGEPAWDVQ